MLPEKRKKKDRSAGISEKVARLLEFYSLVAENRYPKLSFPAEHFSVIRRTVHRYLEIIRTIDAVDVDPDHKACFLPTANRVKKFVTSRDNLATILATCETASHLGKTFQNNLQKLTEKIFAGSSKAFADEKLPIIIRAPQTVKGEAGKRSQDSSGLYSGKAFR